MPEFRVVWKLAFLVLAVGASAVALLSLRQMRTQAAHELAETRLRIMNRDNELWRVRTAIAEGVSPKRVQEMAAGLSSLQPIMPELAALSVPPGAELPILADGEGVMGPPAPPGVGQPPAATGRGTVPPARQLAGTRESSEVEP